MIHKVGEEWSRIGESLRRVEGGVDAGELKQVLHAVKGVRESLKTLCEASVTRANFKAAIREALLPILREHAGDPLPPAVLPAAIRDLPREVAELRGRLEAEGERGRLPREPLVGAAVPAEVLSKLASFEERLERLAEREAEVDGSLGEHAARADRVDERLEEVDVRLEQLEKARGELELQLEERLGKLDARWNEVQAGVGEVNFRVAEVEGRWGQTDAAVGDLEKALCGAEAALGEGFEKSLGRLDESLSNALADAEARRAAQAAGDSGARQALEAQLRLLLQSSLQALDEKLEALGTRLKGSLEEVDGQVFAASVDLGGRLSRAEASIREVLPDLVSQRARELEARVRKELREEIATITQSVACLKDALSRLEASLPVIADRKAQDMATQLREEIEKASQDLAGLLVLLESSVPRTAQDIAERVAGERDEKAARRTASVEADLRGEIEKASARLSGDLSRLEASVPAAIDCRAGEVESGLRKDIQRTVDVFEARLSELRDSIQVFATELEERHTSELANARQTSETQLRGGLLRLEEKMERARSDLSALISRLEVSVPVTVDRKTGDLEAKLQREMDDMVEVLATKLADLREMLVRVEGLIPRREVVDSVDGRLLRLEERISSMAAQVESIDSLTPELKTVAEKLTALRTQLGEVSGGVADAGKGLGDLRESLSSGLSDLELLLNAGIQRWETDQSHMVERLSALRDTLRDQLRAVGERVEGAQGGLLRKLTGNPGGVKLSKDDWDHVSTKIEGIISGLEAILAKKQKR